MTRRAPLQHFAAALTLLTPFLGSCAQLTGLSEDYRYDLGGDGELTDGGASTDGGEGGPAQDAGERCSADEQQRATTSIDDAHGANVDAECTTCLAGECCVAIDACANDDGCRASMQCVFDCQKRGNTRDCVVRCDGAFMRTVGECVQGSCPERCKLE